MPVLCEAISVIVRCSSIEKYFKGGKENFIALIPNQTSCSDGELYRIGFMNPFDVKKYIDVLESNGLQFQKHTGLSLKRFKNRKTNDIVVVDQFQGPTTDCDWIEFGQFNVGDDDVLVSTCWLFEGTRFGLGPQISEKQLQNFAVPNGWDPSHANEIEFKSGSDDIGHLTFLRHENGLDVYFDKEKGTEVYTTETEKRPPKLH